MEYDDLSKISFYKKDIDEEDMTDVKPLLVKYFGYRDDVKGVDIFVIKTFMIACILTAIFFSFSTDCTRQFFNNITGYKVVNMLVYWTCVFLVILYPIYVATQR